MSVEILRGDVLKVLPTLPDDHFDCIVTSPPYWGLRDYGVSGQLGMEPTLAEHIEVMVKVCEQLRRVMKPEGTFWLNYGDCYAGGGRGGGSEDCKQRTSKGSLVAPTPLSATGLKAKDLCMVPNRIAIALQEAGWWVRSEIIWAKPNPMPESVTDRPATSHEKIFLLSKSARYFYDAQAVRQQRVSTGDYKTPDGWDTGPGAHGSVHRSGRQKGESVAEKRDKQRGHGRRHAGFNDRWESEQQASGRNLRNYEPAPVNVWNVATRPFTGAHFATFPAELVERCLKAGCPQGGKVLDPFGGAGTTGLVADRMQLDCTLIELNPEYADIARDRITEDAPLFSGAAE